MTHPAYSMDGERLGDVPLSDNEIARLAAGETITVQWHTPRMLQDQLGTQSGSFSVERRGDRFVTSDAGSVKAYADLQARIAAAASGAS
jgi:hypothetical protein